MKTDAELIAYITKTLEQIETRGTTPQKLGTAEAALAAVRLHLRQREAENQKNR